jgi:hypothetical protein
LLQTGAQVHLFAVRNSKLRACVLDSSTKLAKAMLCSQNQRERDYDTITTGIGLSGTGQGMLDGW